MHAEEGLGGMPRCYDSSCCGFREVVPLASAASAKWCPWLLGRYPAIVPRARAAGSARAARARLFLAPPGGLAKTLSKYIKKTRFSKVTYHLLLGRARTRRDERAFLKTKRARGPAGRTFRFPYGTPSLPPYFVYRSHFASFRRSAATGKMLKVGREKRFALRGHTGPSRGEK